MSLHHLLEEVKRGELRVPKFQRPFVWTDAQRLRLLESVYLGLPIGAFLVWSTQGWREEVGVYANLGPIHLGAERGREGPARLLLDGHQRLTTLFVALAAGIYDPGEWRQMWREDAESEERLWAIYFDLEDTYDAPFRYRSPLAPAPPVTWLPVACVLDTFALHEFSSRLQRHGHPRSMVNRAFSVAEAFREYSLPVMELATEDYSRVIASFARLNSEGTPMSQVHMMNALTYRPGFDLLERLEDMADSLARVGWSQGADKLILGICKAESGLPLDRRAPYELAHWLRQKPDLLDQAHEAIVKVAKFFRDWVGVMGSNMVPYRAQAIILAVTLNRAPDSGISDYVGPSLWRWFWVTTLTGELGGAYSRGVNKALHHVESLVYSDSADVPDEATEVITPIDQFDMRSARSKGLALLLAELEPRTPRGGRANAGKLLAEHGASSLVRLFPSTALPEEWRHLARGPENRFIVTPRQGKALKARLHRSETVDEVASSHAITPAALAALHQHDPVGFLKARRERLLDLEEARAVEVGLTYQRAPSGSSEPY